MKTFDTEELEILCRIRVITTKLRGWQPAGCCRLLLEIPLTPRLEDSGPLPTSSQRAATRTARIQEVSSEQRSWQETWCVLLTRLARTGCSDISVGIGRLSSTRRDSQTDQEPGISYGTMLSATIASIFPDRMDRVVLDGVVNPHEYYHS